MNEAELRGYYDIYTDCWKLFRTHSEPVDDDAFWDQLIAQASLLSKKYEGSELAKEMILSTIAEVERIHKSKK